MKHSECQKHLQYPIQIFPWRMEQKLPQGFSFGCLQSFAQALVLPTQHIHIWAGGLPAPGIRTGLGGAGMALKEQGKNSSAHWGRGGFCDHAWSDTKMHNGFSLARKLRGEAAQEPQHSLLATAGEKTKGTRDLMYLPLEHSIFHKEDCNKPINK